MTALTRQAATATAAGGDGDTAYAVDQLIAAGPRLFDNEVDANNN